MGIKETTQLKGWKETTLGEVASNVSRSFNFKGKTRVIFLNTSDILDGKFLHKDWSNVASLLGQAKKAIECGDILFSEIRPANGRYALVDFDADDYVVSTKFMVIKSGNEIDNRYLYKMLTYKNTLRQFQSVAETRSGTFPQITFDAISYFPIHLPPLLEQGVIVLVLSSLDDKIELLRRQNETLEQIAREIFHEWFVAFNFPNEQGKPYKKSGGKMVESELGEIPEGWRVFSFSDLFTFEKGEKPQKVSDEREAGFVPHILIEALDGGVREYASRKGVFVDEDDILMVMDGASSGRVEIGYSGVIGSTISVLRLKKLLPAIIYFALKQMEENIRKHTTGSAIPHTDKNYVYDFQIALPPDTPLFGQMERVLFSFISKNIRNRKQTRILAQNRDTLLPKLMSGEVRVKI